MKKIISIIITIILALSFTACGNQQFFDTTYTYSYAYIAMPDGSVIEGKVQKWGDYEGDQLQVTIDDITYLTHSTNIVFIAE